MESAAGPVQSLHCTTADWQVRDRVPFWREVFGKKMVHIDIEPERDTPFAASATMTQLPDVRLLSRCTMTPSLLRRPPHLVADGDDAVVILVNLGGEILFSQRGSDVVLAPGEAASFLHAEPAEMRCSHMNCTSIVVPYRIAAGSIRDVSTAAALRRIPADTEVLRLLVEYTQVLQDKIDIASASAEVAHAVAAHLHDLFALAIGATRDATHRAGERGLRAARLQSVKADILGNLASAELTLAAVAQRAGLSPRSIQMLFESEGASFSQYVLESRLARAYRSLAAPRHAHRTISDLAYEAGFGDLSHFYRSFRRRYGASPSEVRAEARGARD